MSRNRKEKISFDDFYAAIYKERWECLKAALHEEKETVSLSSELSKPYYLDRASAMVASLLPVSEGGRILDMCAAPGGKTLSIALRLKGSGELIANDRSPDRRSRLKTVIEECLEEKYRKNIKVTGYDASSWCLYEKDAYDSILLDAPCSSERHVINDPKHLALWSPSRPKRLEKEQFGILASAYLAARAGGYILYSTCSINPGENSSVIERLLSRHENDVEEIDFDLPYSEKLSYGRIILPDTSDGLGPMYACLLRKIK